MAAKLPINGFALRAFFIFSVLAVLVSESVGMDVISDSRKMVLGSRPPGCVNKCMNCRPCEATLIIPPHRTTRKQQVQVEESHSHREDDSYYLLAWRCRCGNKLYQP